MKLSKEVYNGVAIFVGISAYFLLMHALGFADLLFLRLLNVLFVLYGVNKTIQMNLAEGKKTFAANAVSALITSLIGVTMSIAGLVAYSYMKGGTKYVQSLSENFLFGGNPSVEIYCISLLFEGVVSAVIVSFILMMYYNSRFTAD